MLGKGSIIVTDSPVPARLCQRHGLVLDSTDGVRFRYRLERPLDEQELRLLIGPFELEKRAVPKPMEQAFEEFCDLCRNRTAVKLLLALLREGGSCRSVSELVDISSTTRSKASDALRLLRFLGLVRLGKRLHGATPVKLTARGRSVAAAIREAIASFGTS